MTYPEPSERLRLAHLEHSINDVMFRAMCAERAAKRDGFTTAHRDKYLGFKGSVSRIDGYFAKHGDTFDALPQPDLDTHVDAIAYDMHIVLLASQLTFGNVQFCGDGTSSQEAALAFLARARKGSPVDAFDAVVMTVAKATGLAWSYLAGPGERIPEGLGIALTLMTLDTGERRGALMRVFDAMNASSATPAPRALYNVFTESLRTCAAQLGYMHVRVIGQHNPRVARVDPVDHDHAMLTVDLRDPERAQDTFDRILDAIARAQR